MEGRGREVRTEGRADEGREYGILHTHSYTTPSHTALSRATNSYPDLLFPSAAYRSLLHLRWDIPRAETS